MREQTPGWVTKIFTAFLGIVFLSLVFNFWPDFSGRSNFDGDPPLWAQIGITLAIVLAWWRDGDAEWIRRLLARIGNRSKGTKRHGNSVQTRSTSNTSVEDTHLFHLCVLPKKEKSEKMIITAAIAETRNSDGSVQWTPKVYAHHDLLTILETGVAMFWRDKIDSEAITIPHLIDELSKLKGATGSNYLVGEFEYRSPENDIPFYGMLCGASIHTFVAFLDAEHRHPEVQTWFQSELERSGDQFTWTCLIAPAKRLYQAIEMEKVDSDFLELLLESVGINRR